MLHNGYEADEPMFMENHCLLKFHKGASVIKFRQDKGLDKKTYHIDTENAEYTKSLKIGEMEAILVKKDGFTMSFNDGHTYFNIFADSLSESQIIKIASSIKKIEK